MEISKEFRKIINCLVLFVMALFFFPQPTYANLLKISDIQIVMNEMFDQHVEKKEMTPHMMRNAINIYIEQFDRDKIYLLKSEVAAFLNMTDSEIQTIQNAYHENDYAIFAKLNDVINQAVERSIKLRIVTGAERDQLFSDAARKHANKSYSGSLYGDDAEYAENITQLKERIREYQSDFIAAQMSKYRPVDVMKKQDVVLEKLDRKFRSIENQYDLNTTGESDKEHYLTLHILKALAKSLDAHSSFFNDSEAQDMRMRLEKGFKGVGIVIGESLDGFTIEGLIPGGPAERSGMMKVQDQLVQINGVKLDAKDMDDVVQLLRENRDGNIEVMLSRKQDMGGKVIDRLIQVKLVPEVIVIADDRVEVTYDEVNGGIIGKITLHAFYEGENGVSSSKDILKAMKELSTKGNLVGLVLDLRENSGGYLSQAVEVAGLFITNGVVVISQYSNGDKHFYRDLNNNDFYDGPLVILTSKLTASAAEIVAQALQDYGVAVVVGDKQTYGKGTIQAQTVTDGGAGSFFKVTIGKYYTVSGESPQIQGVKADIVVPSIYSHLEIGEEFIDDTLKHDTVLPAYKDSLDDVEGFAQVWYRRHYLPSLQAKESKWNSVLPELKQLSSNRLRGNAAYQNYIKNGINENTAKRYGEPGHLSNDLQMQEAVLIVKDMISLSPRQVTTKQEFVGNPKLKWQER